MKIFDHKNEKQLWNNIPFFLEPVNYSKLSGNEGIQFVGLITGAIGW